MTDQQTTPDQHPTPLERLEELLDGRTVGVLASSLMWRGPGYDGGYEDVTGEELRTLVGLLEQLVEPGPGRRVVTPGEVDPAAVMVEHYDDGIGCAAGCLTDWPCDAYRVAEALARVLEAGGEL